MITDTSPMSTMRSPGRVSFQTSSCSFSMYWRRRSWNTTLTMLCTSQSYIS